MQPHISETGNANSTGTDCVWSTQAEKYRIKVTATAFIKKLPNERQYMILNRLDWSDMTKRTITESLILSEALLETNLNLISAASMIKGNR